MKKNILFFAFTEYQLILTVNELLNTYSDQEQYKSTVVIKQTEKFKRLNQDLDLSCLPAEIIIWQHDYDLDKKLTGQEKREIETIMDMDIDTMIFFQEQDPIMVLLSNHFSFKGATINLYQDGLKPYNAMKYPSLGQIKNDIKQNLWLKRNGYDVPDWFSFLRCHNYGFLKSTKNIFLTFPNAYNNWNKKNIVAHDVKKIDALKKFLEKLFCWGSSLLPATDKTIFFVSQFMRDDGSFELGLIEWLAERYPEKPFYIKLHPLSLAWDPNFIEKLRDLSKPKNIILIESRIPAEIFIMNLADSIIVSSISTAMFIDNPDCRFYYTFELAKEKIKRFNRYKVKNPTLHVKTIYSFNEII